MNPKCILIVDDDPDQRLTLRLPLEANGYAVYEAASYAEGLAAVKEINPDLVILDVMMETTTAGFQFALSIHSPEADFGVQGVQGPADYHAHRYPQHHAAALRPG